MPSGYTAVLYEGEQTFNDFVLQSARGMGAAILMRDTDWDVPITLDRIQESDSYDTEHLEAARKDLAQASAWSDEEAEVMARADWEAQVVAWEEADVKNKSLLDRYDTMLRQVQDWVPPTPDHEGLKKLMIEQLESSIKFDCGSTWRVEGPLTGPEYREQKIALYERDITYHEKQIVEKAERNAGRVAWATALFESLGIEVA